MITTPDMDADILKQYYDPSTGLTSLAKFYTKIKRDFPKLKLKDLKKILANQETVQLHSQRRKPKHLKPIVASYPNHIWQIDLLDISNYSHTNKGINYLLCAVDIATRYARVQPLKTKSALTVRNAMATMLLDEVPAVVQADQGTEFTSKQFKSLIDEYGIKIEYSNVADHAKQGIVERFNRTLRGYIERYRAAYGDSFMDHLQNLVNNYNNTYHNSIGSPPADADMERIRMFNKLRKDKVTPMPELLPGDKVRYIINRSLFSKGAEPKWTKQVFTVKEQKGDRYVLSNGNDYRAYELLKIDDVQHAPPLAFMPKPIELSDWESKPKRQRRFIRKEGIELENQLSTRRSRRAADRGAYLDAEFII